MNMFWIVSFFSNGSPNNSLVVTFLVIAIIGEQISLLYSLCHNWWATFIYYVHYAIIGEQLSFTILVMPSLASHFHLLYKLWHHWQATFIDYIHYVFTVFILIFYWYYLVLCVTSSCLWTLFSILLVKLISNLLHITLALCIIGKVNLPFSHGILMCTFFHFIHLQLFNVAQFPMHLQKLCCPLILRDISCACSSVIVSFPSWLLKWISHQFCILDVAAAQPPLFHKFPSRY